MIIFIFWLLDWLIIEIIMFEIIVDILILVMINCVGLILWFFLYDIR